MIITDVTQPLKFATEHKQVDTISPNQSQAEIIRFAVDRFLGVLRHQNKFVPVFA
jgi:hypothetical protein